MHCDLKPGNILWNHCEKRAYIIDMGLAEFYDGTYKACVSGQAYVTEPYRPP